MQERFYKVVGKVLKLWERLYRREKVGKVSKFQERLFNDNFKAGNGEERKGKGKLSVPPLNQRSQQKHPGTWCILKQEKRGQTCKSCKHAFERSRFQNQEINNEISGLFLLLKAIV